MVCGIGDALGGRRRAAEFCFNHGLKAAAAERSLLLDIGADFIELFDADSLGEQGAIGGAASLTPFSVFSKRMSSLKMTNKIIFAFLFGALIPFLGMVAFRVALFNQHFGDFNTHPIAGLLAAPLVVTLAACLGGVVVYALSFFFRMYPSIAGAATFGCWCMLPFILLGLGVDENRWPTVLLTAPLVPIVLGARWRTESRKERKNRESE